MVTWIIYIYSWGCTSHWIGSVVHWVLLKRPRNGPLKRSQSGPFKGPENGHQSSLLKRSHCPLKRPEYPLKRIQSGPSEEASERSIEEALKWSTEEASEWSSEESSEHSTDEASLWSAGNLRMVHLRGLRLSQNGPPKRPQSGSHWWITE